MSGFLLVHSSLGGGLAEQLAQTQEAAGFERVMDRQCGLWRLIQFAPLSANRPVATVDDGLAPAIGVHGHFSYKGLTGRDGLLLARSDIGQGSFSLDDAVGPFVLALGDDSGARLLRDPLSPLRLYVNRDRTVVSTLFMSLVEASSSLSIDPQGFYEYLWLESLFGTRTPFAQIEVLPPGDTVMLGDRGLELAAVPFDFRQPDQNPWALDDSLEHYAKTLVGLHKPMLNGFGQRVRTALSGGFDSRLCVAIQRAVGCQTELQVHGGPQSPDRQVAETIATALKLPLRIVDTSVPTPVIPHEQFRSHNDCHIIRADGPGNYGSLSSGVGTASRLSRLEGVDMYVNGGGGEIFRNFLYLRDRQWSVSDIVSSFYSRHQVSANTARFDAATFIGTVEDTLAAAIGAPDTKTPLPRSEVERAYPLFRLRYWTALDLMINTRVGGAFYPFLCHQSIAGTQSIPMHWKTHGRFEARLIEHLDRELASFGSDYGFSFTQGPSLAYRMKMLSTYWRPMWLRRHSYDLQTRWRSKPNEHMSLARRQELFDPRMPGVSPWVAPFALVSGDAFARAATIEFIMAWRERADKAGGGANLIAQGAV